VLCSWVETYRYRHVSIFKLQEFILYMGAEGCFETLVPDNQANIVTFILSPSTSALSHKKPCDLKKMFLQLSVFWRLD